MLTALESGCYGGTAQSHQIVTVYKYSLFAVGQVRKETADEAQQTIRRIDNLSMLILKFGISHTICRISGLLMNKKCDSFSQTYHPLMNVTLPLAKDLINRCNDDESVTHLNAACRFAADRCQCKKQLRVAYKALRGRSGKLQD